MKKTKKIVTNVASLCSALLLTSACFATQVDNEAIANECTALGSNLNQLSKIHTEEYCSYDVSNAGLLLENTAHLIRGNRLEQAVNNLSFAGGILTQVKLNRHDCAYFSVMVTPYVERVDFFKNQLRRGTA